jgi:hypothetical protein
MDKRKGYVLLLINAGVRNCKRAQKISAAAPLNILNFVISVLTICMSIPYLAIWGVNVYISRLLRVVNKGNNKITELRAILQRESQNSGIPL